MMVGNIHKFVLYLIGAVVSIPVVLILTLMWLQRGEHEPTFYVHVTVDLYVNDQPIKMERVITCETVALGNSGLESLGQRSYTEYRPYPLAFGKRLPDKSAVMMWTPYHCDREEYLDEKGEKQIRAMQNSSDYVPRIGWTPEYEQIETLEYYIDRQSFLSPDARIRDIKITSVLLSDSGFPFYFPEKAPSKPDDFLWFSGTVGQRENPKVRFTSFFAQVLSEEEWRGYNPLIDSELDSYKKTKMIVHNPQLESNSPVPLIGGMFRELAFNRELTPGYSGRGVYSQRLNYNGLSRGFGVELKGNGQIVQLLPQNDGFKFAKEKIWDRLIFQRVRKSHNKIRDRGISPDATAYIFGDVKLAPVGGKQPSLFLYDPISRDLFLINRSFYNVYPEKDNPLFSPKP